MSGIAEKDRLDYYWKHFALIADQRVKTFNLYVVVVAATLVATISALRPSTPRLTLILVGFGHMFCVFVFGMIERRGRAIVKVAKAALRDFEASSAFGDGYKPMTQDGRGEGKGPFGMITYGNAFSTRLLGTPYLRCGDRLFSVDDYPVPTRRLAG